METPYKLLGQEGLQEILRTLPVDKLLEFRTAAKDVHCKQLQLINNILKEKGHIEDHLSAPCGGYNE